MGLGSPEHNICDMGGRRLRTAACGRTQENAAPACAKAAFNQVFRTESAFASLLLAMAAA
jgi:hypothetical protein